MKSLSTLALATLATAAFAHSASAYTLSPTSTAFVAKGLAAVTLPAGGVVNCNLTFKGKTTTAGKAKITTVTITPGISACSTSTAGNLPWGVSAVSATAAKITNVTLITPLGTAGPATVKFSDNASGVWTITNASLAGGYKLNVTMTTTPAITIAP